MGYPVKRCETCTVHMDELMPLIRERLEAGQTVRFMPKGISMRPMLREARDTVTIAPINRPLKKYDITLFVRDDGSYVLHRIVGTGETYTCIGDNQFVSERVKPQQMIAVVCAFSRDDKEYSVLSPIYRVYCRIWHYSRFFRRCFRAARVRIKRITNLK